MGLYSRVIFPRLCDWLLSGPPFELLRKQQLAEVRGEILEIGVGTGLNLPHYPPHVRRIAAVDPNRGMNKLLHRRIGQTGIEVDQHNTGGESLPFDAGRFDCVVSTLTLCSIAEVKRALREVARVLKPGGRFLFLEHGLSPDARVERWQRRLNPIERIVGDGCRLDLDVRGLLAAAPFESVEIENFQLARIPRTHGSMVRGTARK